MAVGHHARRLPPTLLVSLALLLLGLCGLVAPAASLAGLMADAGPSATTVVHPVDHAIGRGEDTGAQSRVTWQRQSGAAAGSIVAVLFAAFVGCSLAPWRATRSGMRTRRAAHGRFARDSRAPPRRLTD